MRLFFKRRFNWVDLTAFVVMDSLWGRGHPVWGSLAMVAVLLASCVGEILTGAV